VGEGGILVEPEEEALYQPAVRILSDSSYRQTWIEKGWEWVKKFPPSATAGALLSLYRSCL